MTVHPLAIPAKFADLPILANGRFRTRFAALNKLGCAYEVVEALKPAFRIDLHATSCVYGRTAAQLRLAQGIENRKPDPQTPMSLLYAEDDENDAFLTERALERCKYRPAVKIVTDGQQCIEYLSGAGDFADRERHPLPKLLLLDINMPHKNGFEVLAWVRAQEQFKSLPVVIYSASDLEQDRRRAGELGASDYMVKPVGVAQSASIIEQALDKWLTH